MAFQQVSLPEGLLDAIWALDPTAPDAVHEGVPLYDVGFWKEAKKSFSSPRESIV